MDVSIPVLVNEPAGMRSQKYLTGGGFAVSIPVLVNEPAGAKQLAKEEEARQRSQFLFW